MKLLVDMNMSPRWADVLADAGHDVTHWSQLGLAYAPDHEIMAFAASNGYAVFTNDLDFGEILAETNALGPSVIQVRVGNLRPEVIGLKVIAALKQSADALAVGAFVSLDPRKTRMRVLPLNRWAK
jgi:predicted nuclease of predicted toxin-antitoxin system